MHPEGNAVSPPDEWQRNGVLHKAMKVKIRIQSPRAAVPLSDTLHALQRSEIFRR